MKRILISIIAFFLVVSSSYGTHLMGGQISATYLSTDTSGSHYFLELDIYRDTLGIPMSIHQYVEIYELDTTGLYNLISIDSISLGASGSVASMSSVYGVEIYHFADSIIFPSNGYYMIKWTHCCRNAAILNMSSPLSEDMTFLTYVNVDNTNPNSSPTYLAPPVIYLPANTLWQYNPIPFDMDGDSLVWDIATPMSGSSVVSGYEFLSDTILYSNSNGIFTMDSLTGQITWSPKMLGNFVASFVIQEYRNGVLVGAMSRDMQFVVVSDSSNAVPSISYLQAPSINNLGYPYVKIMPGQNYSLSLLASDADINDVVTMKVYGEPLEVLNPATFTTNFTGNGNEISGTFSWNPNIDQVRSQPYTVVFRATDNFFYFDETIQIEVSLSTSLNNPSILGANEIYPNPAKNSFTLPIYVDEVQSVKLEIYSILGVKISSEIINLSKGNNIILKNFDLDSGHYFVNISNNYGLSLTAKKLIVVR